MTGLRPLAFSSYKMLLKVVRWTGLGTVYPFENAHLYILSHLRPQEVTVNGLRIRLDRTDNCKLSYDDLHGFETSFLASQVRRGDVILDIGANIGYYTLLLARAAGPDGHVYAFEPDPTNCELLKKNVEINSINNVTVIPKAVSDVTGTSRLFLSKTHAGTHRIYPSRHCRSAIEIETVTVDDFIGGISRPVDIVKMDIEGAEPRAFRGMTELLKRNPHIGILTEFHPAALSEQGTPPADFLRQLGSLGLQIQHVDAETGTVNPLCSDAVLKAYPSLRKGVTNLWCTVGASASPPEEVSVR